MYKNRTKPNYIIRFIPPSVDSNLQPYVLKSDALMNELIILSRSVVLITSDCILELGVKFSSRMCMIWSQTVSEFVTSFDFQHFEL